MTARSFSRSALALAFGGGLAALGASTSGCGPEAPAASAPPGWTQPADGVKGVSSGSSVEKLFPLVDGNTYSYETVTLDDRASSTPGILVARVHRASPTSGELRLPRETRHIEYAADGVVALGQNGARGYVLQAPLAVGKQWLSERGGMTRVTAVDVKVTVPAGTYSGCVTTEELRNGDAPMILNTTYCPDIGITVLSAEAGGKVERATLKTYGPPVDIGPDGMNLTTQ